MKQKQIKTRKLNDSWMLGEEIPDVDFLFSEIWLTCFVDQFAKFTGRAYRRILCIYRGYHLWFYYGEKDSYSVGEHIVEKFLKQPSFVATVNEQIVVWSDKLRSFAQSLPETGLANLSNRKLWQFYDKHNELHTRYYEWGWIPVAADMFHNNLTIALKKLLLKQGVPPNKVNQVFVDLTQPEHKSLIQIEREEFLALAACVQQNREQRGLFTKLYQTFSAHNEAKFGYQTHTPEYEALLEQHAATLASHISPVMLRRIQAHYVKYFYVNHMWVGSVHTFEYYVKELAKFVQAGTSAAGLLRKEKSDYLSNITQRRTVLKQYRITGQTKLLFDGFGDFMVTKIHRRFAQIFALYKLEFLLLEIARRLRLTLKEVRFMLPSEVERALSTGKLDRATLRKRTQLCAMVVEKGIERVSVGQRAKKLTATVVKSKIQTVSEFRGQTGCVGKASGKVKIIIRPSDMSKMEKGDILVSIATDPDIVPAMKKAAAIVTEQGGVTSHAAIVSRELGIPCVIGTKIATKVLKDGDVVEVDATNGLVKRL